MAHRLAGYLVAALVVAASARTLAAARAGTQRRRLALLAPALVLVQVGLGLLTVASYVSLPVVSLHLAGGAGLLATLLVLFLQLGPRGEALPLAGHGHVGGLAPAAG
jgi:heme A synthase